MENLISNTFVSFIDNDEESTMHSKSDNIEITIIDEADKITFWFT